MKQSFTEILNLMMIILGNATRISKLKQQYGLWWKRWNLYANAVIYQMHHEDLERAEFTP